MNGNLLLYKQTLGLIFINGQNFKIHIELHLTNSLIKIVKFSINIIIFEFKV